jgi:methylated-DNA-[protein]-cysteine S-methyltransferase
VTKSDLNGETIRYAYVGSPMGDIMVTGSEHELHLIALPLGSEKKQPDSAWVHDPRTFMDTARQITEYFAGERRVFDLPLRLQGTAFQKLVWRALGDIPYGETVSYFELACRIGRPTAARAVGSANARNPFSIVLPCHRVVGTTGALTGYSGGLKWKENLLRLEGALPPNPITPA